MLMLTLRLVLFVSFVLFSEEVKFARLMGCFQLLTWQHQSCVYSSATVCLGS